MLDSLLGGLLSAPALIALVGLIVKIFPSTMAGFSTWLYAHVDPGRLPYDSAMNRHWEESREVMVQLREIQKDTIKNTLMSLMEQPGDQSVKVRYELAKLERLHAECWIMGEAEQYLEAHHHWRAA
jgi:hypothetical protein